MCRLSWNLGASVSWKSQGLSTTVMGLLYVNSKHPTAVNNPHSKLKSDSLIQDCAPTVHRLCAYRAVSCRVAIIYIMSFAFALHSHTVSESHTQDCAPTVHRLCAYSVVSCRVAIIYIMSFAFALHSHTVSDSHIQDCAPAVLRLYVYRVLSP